MLQMTVHAQCGGSGGLECADPGAASSAANRKAQLRGSCLCASEQSYLYDWDELNRIARARRYDRDGGSGDWDLAARMRYRYDSANQRTVKEVHSPLMPGPGMTGGPLPDRVALYVFPGDFERRRLETSIQGDEYQLLPGPAETQYLISHTRLVWKPGTTAGQLDQDHRITFASHDFVGSTKAVADLVSGELLESTSYYPHGARESFLTSTKTSIAPEPTSYSGMESDEEVGIVYFHHRYLVPRIARWLSPDPIHIHAIGGGEVLNSFHYVSGSNLQVRDPNGLGAHDGEPTQAIPVDYAVSERDTGRVIEVEVDFEQPANGNADAFAQTLQWVVHHYVTSHSNNEGERAQGDERPQRREETLVGNATGLDTSYQSVEEHSGDGRVIIEFVWGANRVEHLVIRHEPPEEPPEEQEETAEDIELPRPEEELAESPTFSQGEVPIAIAAGISLSIQDFIGPVGGEVGTSLVGSNTGEQGWLVEHPVDGVKGLGPAANLSLDASLGRSDHDRRTRRITRRYTTQSSARTCRTSGRYCCLERGLTTVFRRSDRRLSRWRNRLVSN